MVIAVLVILLVLTAVLGARSTPNSASKTGLKVLLITLAQVAVIVAFMFFFRTPPTQ